MMLPYQSEGVVQERMSVLENEIRYQELLAMLPQEPARWRRWTGDMMVIFGTWLLRIGERVARRERQESVSVAR